eukprot:24562_1
MANKRQWGNDIVTDHEVECLQNKEMLQILNEASSGINLITLKDATRHISAINVNYFTGAAIKTWIEQAKQLIKSRSTNKQAALFIYFLSHGNSYGFGPVARTSQNNEHIFHEDIYRLAKDDFVHPLIVSIWTCLGSSLTNISDDADSTMYQERFGNEMKTMTRFDLNSGTNRIIIPHEQPPQSIIRGDTLYRIQNGSIGQTLIATPLGTPNMIAFFVIMADYLISNNERLSLDKLVRTTAHYATLILKYHVGVDIKCKADTPNMNNFYFKFELNDQCDLVNNKLYKEKKKIIDDVLLKEKQKYDEEQEAQRRRSKQLRKIRSYPVVRLVIEVSDTTDMNFLSIQNLLGYIRMHMQDSCLTSELIDYTMRFLPFSGSAPPKEMISFSEVEPCSNVIANSLDMLNNLQEISNGVFFIPTDNILTDNERFKHFEDHCETRNQLSFAGLAVSLFCNFNGEKIYQLKDTKCNKDVMLCVIGDRNVEIPQLHAVISMNKTNKIIIQQIPKVDNNVFDPLLDVYEYLRGDSDVTILLHMQQDDEQILVRKHLKTKYGNKTQFIKDFSTYSNTDEIFIINTSENSSDEDEKENEENDTTDDSMKETNHNIGQSKLGKHGGTDVIDQMSMNKQKKNKKNKHNKKNKENDEKRKKNVVYFDKIGKNSQTKRKKK